ncbi:ATP-binding cassette domain-containing protein, partial [Bordetella pertussis]|uniref:ATP-binding cassette domain-containing protein n=1 Tax=Bordetella pertussis TaxID=520 RepID=UPI0012B41309
RARVAPAHAAQPQRQGHVVLRRSAQHVGLLEHHGLARARALHALERVELIELAGRNAKSMSGGQQQRLALARAWALEPEVLLLDEPTASLDPHAKRDVELLMEQFARPRDGLAPAMIFSSHNLGQVKRLARRVIYLERGRILADLPVDQFFNGPLPEAAALFVKGERIP